MSEIIDAQLDDMEGITVPYPSHSADADTDVAVTGPRKEWERLPVEPTLWYDKFTSYLSLPPMSRTMMGAYKAYVRRTDPARARVISFTRTPASWMDNCVRYRWEERAAAYDLQRSEHHFALLDEQKEALEEECRQALLTTLRKTMESIEHHKPESMSLQGAVYAIPRLMTAIRDFYQLDKPSKVTIDQIMGLLPQDIRTAVLSAVNIETVNVQVNVNQKQVEDEGEVDD